ncbi:hypothetical protein A2X44_00715 [candidate division CPR3 bacterium GWF2_35_18]|uniref:UMP kinase n=1 Tax=candidate division CPR3 bacterium GW2011_GWF2_35_18 TaxID=1618350 RepID=A0A0G0C2E2_UNCC3|nr:MAG: Uridylate kinase [candidate division CPR3 bacterium GW2011_GWF2_35_18]KKP86324.1 MAG: Uridylate kinase [candidate division CPR3 bacterium GW2011_GWE2_35_7]OGB63432.1 MAG: hypothetical protein A2X44_00715 [candidate division CPR3 bacterium GWF2_35_18]OGB64823.1 MAG: hypothetical protein A2250_05315 [candidate division CPR3 bacterium RIFOXYA2_FULL_35_13]OGB76940.1 MAG: hypothetical protein A2476_05135 [candidate division CPR3 bacterium RIFOXYC2_FULL_35_7]OGB79166.1 MAG: hypothetical prot
MNNLFIIKLGGSLVVPETDKFNLEYLVRLKNVLEKFTKQGKKFVIIIGGGKICRWYQSEAKRLKVDVENKDLNWIGAYVTRVNAEVVNSFMKPLSHDRAYVDFSEKLELTKPVLVVGAWKPEKSTNMDAVLMAEMFNSGTIINLSDIDHVYDKDPKEFPDAKPLDQITWSDYEKIIADRIGTVREHKAGDNLPFDVIATAKAEELKLKVIFINGKYLDNFEVVLNGKDFVGTTIG